MKTQDSSGWVFVAPAMVIMGLVGLVPLLTVVNYSFFEIFILESRFWVGLEWYTEIIRAPRFWSSFGRSTLFSALILLIQIPLGIAIALCIPRGKFWVGITLALVALPLLVPWNMIPSLWLSLLNPETGILGRILPNLGWPDDWKLSAPHTWAVIIAMDVWHWTSLVVILCYSALTTIPAAYYQAAAIDGASPWQVFRHIQLPRLLNVLLMAILLRFMDSFMIYTEAFPINAGGPDGATLFLAVDLGEEIKAFNYGPSAARSVIYFLIIVSVAWLFSKAQGKLDRAGAT
ncbi:carbohydrate ABC transporter permease [Sulfitobacter geojensis]|uniref:Sugar ABC transporter permease n=1 Tax=Sulfitobacter geojensis TaxID=1342299 RepID=A0AAE2W1R7_9RHOB|nr:sugar ABC transporter permease [Sulfitobacter geojensis]MBM1690927.1 sugar ABC transporter permease [Sulfitobacter geojensis]MBM1694993.1 sugar ABC transporter permease [Sulfitobacter geojensis]MBM1706853.1 sugar ABC transporter permease [Sulfitobacter geojensis]MBM1710911.1 sugar ABC transporter permease [Sulfitobacter geojensis]MBM1714977.1 sugar ABC transporter permease [Sulfitobacter geojensis]